MTLQSGSVEAAVGPETAEFSRLVSIEDLGSSAIERRLIASEIECSALAKRFGVTALRCFAADIVLTRRGRSDLVILEGHLTAEVEQPCVVTLEPVNETVDERFVMHFTLASAENSELDVTVDPEADDPPEPVGPEGIDVGEVIAQHLSAAINPYPRGADAAEALQTALATHDRGEAEPAGKREEWDQGIARGSNPFAILETLRGGRKDDRR